MKKATAISCVFLDIGGVLLTDGPESVSCDSSTFLRFP
jgi:hypothetical protein